MTANAKPESAPANSAGIENFYRALLISSAFLCQSPSRGLEWLKIRPGLEGGFARNVAIYLAHTELGVTLTVIGQALGLERTGIGAAAQVIEDLREDRDFEALLGCMGQALRQAQAISARLPEVLSALQKKTSLSGHEKSAPSGRLSASLSTSRSPRAAPRAQSSSGENPIPIPPARAPLAAP